MKLICRSNINLINISNFQIQYVTSSNQFYNKLFEHLALNNVQRLRRISLCQSYNVMFPSLRAHKNLLINVDFRYNNLACFLFEIYILRNTKRIRPSVNIRKEKRGRKLGGSSGFRETLEEGCGDRSNVQV